ncbi:MAG: hypothetical protein ACHQ2Y_04940 [Candidatus Lutacidiplasmatales archaeon]
MRTAHGEAMTSTAEQMAAYGAVNGLGFHGDSRTKAKLVRSMERAIERGDWDRVVELAFSYGAGSLVGSLLRPTLERLSAGVDDANSRWG